MKDLKQDIFGKCKEEKILIWIIKPYLEKWKKIISKKVNKQAIYNQKNYQKDFYIKKILIKIHQKQLNKILIR